MKILNSQKLRDIFIGGAKMLEINKAYVDSLNVFPVPDGDTGTNMSLTLASAVREMNAVTSEFVDDIVNAYARGALKGARGNSGVILSQIIKGLAKVLGESKEITTKDFAKAFASATEVAYNAVTKPQEGTILTVIRYVAEKAGGIATRNSNFSDFFEGVISKAEEILARTPEMLPVLKKAGVVDAGGKGLVFVLQGFKNVVNGVNMDDIVIDTDQADALDNFTGDIHDLENIKYAYCTEFFVINLKNSTTEEDIEKLKDRLLNIGDSVITIGDLSMVKVHVHTNEPGKALQYAIGLGELDKIKIENMLEQNRELIARKESTKKAIGMISICTGEGMANIFKDMQVDTVIEGGQTMNPSVEDILSEIERINSDNIIVLPNNKNIILAAEQAKELTKKNVVVLQTTNVPQGVAATVVFDINASLENNTKAMTNAYEQIKYGEITYAVRNTEMDGFQLKDGDIIGLTGKKIVSKADNVNTSVEEVLDLLVDEDMSVVTLYYGEHVTQEEADSLIGKLSDKYEDLEIDAYFGGQPHYFYLISVE